MPISSSQLFMEIPQGSETSPLGYGDNEVIVANENNDIEHLLNTAKYKVGEMIFGDDDEESREIKKLAAMSI